MKKLLLLFAVAVSYFAQGQDYKGATYHCDSVAWTNGDPYCDDESYNKIGQHQRVQVQQESFMSPVTLGKLFGNPAGIFLDMRVLEAFRPPYLTATQMSTLSTTNSFGVSHKYAMIMNSTTNSLHYWNGSAWVDMGSNIPTWQSTLNVSGGSTLTQNNTISLGNYTLSVENGHTRIRARNSSNFGELDVVSGTVRMSVNNQQQMVVIDSTTGAALIGNPAGSNLTIYTKTGEQVAEFSDAKLVVPTTAYTTPANIAVFKGDTLCKIDTADFKTLLGITGEAWLTDGNSNIDTVNEFFGTTDNSPILLRQNNTWHGIISQYPYYNIGLGYLSLQESVNGGIGNFNTAFGSMSLMTGAGINNVAVGYSTLKNSGYGLGYQNTAVGAFAMSSGLNEGNNNTAIGAEALYGNSTGEYNIGIGVDAGYHNHSGSDNVFIGNYAGTNSLGSNNVYIGKAGTNLTGSAIDHVIAIGYGVQVTKPNGIFFGDSSLFISAKLSGYNDGDVLTVNADGEATWQAPAGGGGSTSCTSCGYDTTVLIDSSILLYAGTNNVKLLPDLPNSQYYIFTGMEIEMINGTVGYTTSVPQTALCFAVGDTMVGTGMGQISNTVFRVLSTVLSQDTGFYTFGLNSGSSIKYKGKGLSIGTSDATDLTVGDVTYKAIFHYQIADSNGVVVCSSTGGGGGGAGDGTVYLPDTADFVEGTEFTRDTANVSKVGNTVTVSGAISEISTANAGSILLSLPYASDLTSITDLSGSLSGNAAVTGMYIIGDPATNKAKFNLGNAGLFDMLLTYTFTYRIK